MPAPKKKAPVAKKEKPLTAKELQKKVDELTDLSERLKLENEEIKLKFKLICRTIVDRTDFSQYNYIEPDTDPELIDIKDIIHMIQKLGLLATDVKASSDYDIGSFEFRLSELMNAESSIFQKFKMQERLEFIKQERDVWKRNADTYKTMYLKLAKENEQQPLLTINNCVVNQTKPIKEVPTESTQKREVQVKQCCKNCKPQNNNSTLPVSSRPDSAVPKNYFQKDFDNEQPTDSNSQIERPTEPMIRNLNRKKFEGIPFQLEKPNSFFSVDSSSIDIIERPLRKNVSFNKDIDVGIFRKDSKNLKLIESYLQPLPIPQIIQVAEQIPVKDESNQKRIESPLAQKNEITRTNSPNSIDVQVHIRNLLNSRNSVNTMNSLFSIVNRRTSSPLSSTSSDNKYTNRGSVCSKRKFPADTPVKDLEPTLKMIIIKELSMEKIDGNDWKMFARRIGINENEVKEWETLKLQYPMARVLSFWSSRSDATVRLLHRHLNAPCFNYSVLAKRIENFYDVL